MSLTTTNDRTGEVLAAVSKMVVGVYADHLGRGPTKARSYLHDNVVVCLLDDTLTKAEHTLVNAGRPEHVRELRESLQETMRESLIEGMEALAGQKVVEVIYGHRVEAGMALQVFVLDGRAPTKPTS